MNRLNILRCMALLLSVALSAWVQAGMLYFKPIVIESGMHQIRLPAGVSTRALMAEGAMVTLGQERMTLNEAMRLDMVRFSALTRAADGQALVKIENLDPAKRLMAIHTARERPSLFELASDTGMARRTLREAGYAAEPSEDYRQQTPVRRFQSDNGLPATGRFDAATLAALKQHREVASFLQSSESAAKGLFHVVHLTRMADPSRKGYYRVQTGVDKARWLDTPNALATHVRAVARERSKGADDVPIYLVLDGPQTNLDQLMLSLSLFMREGPEGRQPPILVVSVEQGRTKGARAPDIKRLFQPIEPGLGLLTHDDIAAGPHGRHVCHVDLLAQGQNLRMTVQDRDQSFLRRFLDTLMALFRMRSSYQDMSYMALIQKARVETAQALGRPLSEVDQQFSFNLEGTQLAQDWRAMPMVAMQMDEGVPAWH